MAFPKRLTIGDLQLSLIDDTARFHPPLDRVVVEARVQEHIDFLERWLELSENSRPRAISEQERELRGRLMVATRHLTKIGFNRAQLAQIVRLAATSVKENLLPELSETQLEESSNAVIAELFDPA